MNSSDQSNERVDEHAEATDQVDFQSLDAHGGVEDAKGETYTSGAASTDASVGGESVEELRRALDDANRRTLMAHAELENARKRMRRDYEDQLKYAALPLLKDFLPVLDNLQRALSAAGNTEASAGLIEGVSMVVKHFEDTLRKHHCIAIPTEGELFDPNYHEAISQMASDQIPEGVVAHQAVTGYQLHDRVVRPSQVVVSTGPAKG